MDTVCEKDWGAPDPISEEGIDRVSNLLRSGRLFRFFKKEKQKAHNLLVKFSSVSATVHAVSESTISSQVPRWPGWSKRLMARLEKKEK